MTMLVSTWMVDLAIRAHKQNGTAMGVLPDGSLVECTISEGRSLYRTGYVTDVEQVAKIVEEAFAPFAPLVPYLGETNAIERPPETCGPRCSHDEMAGPLLWFTLCVVLTAFMIGLLA